jgi:hypothetical protein
MASGDSRYEKTEGTISMEDTFVRHFMYALDRLQSTWSGDSGLDERKFNMQLLYLIRILPDKKKQESIFKQWKEAKDDMGDLPFSEGERRAYAGMEIVTELILFVCDAFELINTDITGPATSKQYQDAVLQLPDMEDTDPLEIT